MKHKATAITGTPAEFAEFIAGYAEKEHPQFVADRDEALKAAALSPFLNLKLEFEQSAEDHRELYNGEQGTRADIVKSGTWTTASRMLAAAIAKASAQ